MREAYKHDFIVVFASDLIPLGGQPENGYTLQQAVDRINREVSEKWARKFNVTDRDFNIIQLSTGCVVL